jgi:hypothetical protein
LVSDFFARMNIEQRVPFDVARAGFRIRCAQDDKNGWGTETGEAAKRIERWQSLWWGEADVELERRLLSAG